MGFRVQGQGFVEHPKVSRCYSGRRSSGRREEIHFGCLLNFSIVWVIMDSARFFFFSKSCFPDACGAALALYSSGILYSGQISCDAPDFRFRGVEEELDPLLGRALGHFIFSLIGLRRIVFTNFFQQLSKPHLGYYCHCSES